jgi:hypothetical protein
LAITHGARVIDSTPPATTTSALPHCTACAALATAVSPEAHSRFTVYAETASGRPPAAPPSGDVAVVLAGLVGRTEHDLVDPVGVHAGPPHGLAHHQGGQVVGPHARERPP